MGEQYGPATVYIDAPCDGVTDVSAVFAAAMRETGI